MSGPLKTTKVDVSDFGDEVGAWVKNNIGRGGTYVVERGTEGATLGGHRLVTVRKADKTSVEDIPRIVSTILLSAALRAANESGGISALGAEFQLEEPSEAKRLTPPPAPLPTSYEATPTGKAAYLKAYGEFLNVVRNQHDDDRALSRAPDLRRWY